MHTQYHGLVTAHLGDSLRLEFVVTDKSGANVDLSAASAVYKLARRHDAPAVVVLNGESGVAMLENVVSVSLDTASIARTGDFFGQLFVTIDGETLVVAEGPVHIAPVIENAGGGA